VAVWGNFLKARSSATRCLMCRLSAWSRLAGAAGEADGAAAFQSGHGACLDGRGYV